MPGAVIVIRQQAPHEARDLDPAAIVALFEWVAHLCPCSCFWADTGKSAKKKRGEPSRLAAFGTTTCNF
jgi:hypothetical protein